MSGRFSKPLSARVASGTSGEHVRRKASSLGESGTTAPHIKGQTEAQSWPLLLSGQWAGYVLLAALEVPQPTVASAEAAVNEDSSNAAIRVRVSRQTMFVIRLPAAQVTSSNQVSISALLPTHCGH